MVVAREHALLIEVVVPRLGVPRVGVENSFNESQMVSLSPSSGFDESGPSFSILIK